MRTVSFKQRVLAGDQLVGTFVRTASHEIIEVLAQTKLDFICLDVEHAGIDRRSMDVCLSVARAWDLPVLVRVSSGAPEHLLQALDAGAVGVVVPHVRSAKQAAEIAKSAHYGQGGRGFHGSNRWAGLGTQTMPDILARSHPETLVLAQIEEPEGVEAAAEIAAISGIDGLFVGPADLSVCFGKQDLDSDELDQAFKSVSIAAKTSGKAMVTFVAMPERAEQWSGYGISVWLVASELTWIAQAANTIVADMPKRD